MSSFCLVHGSTQGPSGWDRLVPLLRERGHETVCVDLPTNQPDWSAHDYAAVMGAAAAGLSDPAVVVAHSASGLFLPFVPAVAKVAKLVYLAAVIPSPGASFLARFQADPAMYHAAFVGKDLTKDEALAREYLFHDCSPDVARWAASTLRLMFAKRAVTEASPFENWPAVPALYISCTEDRAINAEWWEKAARSTLGAAPVRMTSGHCPHVSQPAELAAILHRYSIS